MNIIFIGKYLLVVQVILGLAITDSHAWSGSKYIRNKKQPGIIIFVHGVLGDATETWTNDTTNMYWPKLLTSDPVFNEMDIYTYEYPTNKISKSYSINELAENMRLILRTDGVLKREKIAIISHSMGGLVTRSLILKYRKLSSKIKLLHFFSTPTTGSVTASLAKLFSRNTQFKQIVSMKPESFLANLQRDWLAANFKIPSYCAYEKKKTYGILIVDQQSATNLCNKRLDPIDKNHIDIVKPKDDRDVSYRAFKDSFLETFPELNKSTESPQIETTKDEIRILWPYLMDNFYIKNMGRTRVEWMIKNFPTEIISLIEHPPFGEIQPKGETDLINIKGDAIRIIQQDKKYHSFLIVSNNMNNNKKMFVVTDNPETLRTYISEIITKPKPISN